MNGYYGYPQGGPPSVVRGVSPVVWVLVGALVFGLFGACGTCGYFAMTGASEPNGGGVIFAEQVPDATKKKLDQRGLLESGERLLVYYDASMSFDQSELALVTDQRVIHATTSKKASLRLAEVVSIDHSVEGLLGDVILVAAKDGARLRIEIAHLNGGDSFLTALEDEVKKQNPDVRVRRAK